MRTAVKIIMAFLVAAGSIYCAGPTVAQSYPLSIPLSYPTKQIRLIVPFSPGGLADIVARIITQPAAQQLGQSIIVDNRPGADGAIAGSITAKAAPDGYTLFYATSTAMSAAPTLRKNPPYNPVKDFTAITDFGRNLFFMYVHPSLPVRTLPELINHIRANPGKLNYGAISSTSMVATAQLLLLYKVDAVRIPYNGEAPAIPDIVTNRIQFGFMTAGPAYAQAREGKLRVLATLTPRRSALAPDVPTLEEAGVKGVSTSSWGGLFGPARMPAPIVERLSREFRAVLSRPDVVETLGRQGFLARGSTPVELEALVKEQLETWSRIVREAGIPVE
jgi:tripartite-type tricarboxylate transporter receptor subunit TctC